MKKQIKKLTTILGIGGLNGTIAIAALNGLFTIKNLPVIAFVFLAGPVAILTAVMIQGQIQERMIIALVSGILATGIIMLAAGFGPVLLSHFNLKVLQVAGGIALMAIALLIMGFKISENIPFVIVLLGLIGGLLLK